MPGANCGTIAGSPVMLMLERLAGARYGSRVTAPADAIGRLGPAWTEPPSAAAGLEPS